MDFPDHIRRRMNNPEDYRPVNSMSEEELEEEVTYLRGNRDYWHGACLSAQGHRDEANASLERYEAETREYQATIRGLRGALKELRTRLHVSGRRPEECYEMSMIDDILMTEDNHG